MMEDLGQYLASLSSPPKAIRVDLGVLHRFTAWKDIGIPLETF
jgi:hypothetical protein